MQDAQNGDANRQGILLEEFEGETRKNQIGEGTRHDQTSVISSRIEPEDVDAGVIGQSPLGIASDREMPDCGIQFLNSSNYANALGTVARAC